MGNRVTGLKLKPLSEADIEGLKNDVEFSTEEIKTWYYEFQDSCTEGRNYLTVDDFRRVYTKVFKGDSNNFATHIFRTFDLHKTGEVGFREFVIGMSVSSSENRATKLRWAFSVYDIDSDGFISKEELHEIITAAVAMVMGKWILSSEFSQELTDSQFEKLDLDRDELISWDEFVVGVDTDSMILDLLECGPIHK